MKIYNNVKNINLKIIINIIFIILISLIIADMITTLYGLTQFGERIYEENLITSYFINNINIFFGIIIVSLIKSGLGIFIYFLDTIFEKYKFTQILATKYVQILMISVLLISVITTFNAVVGNFIKIL